jgi:hypothetical protein
MSKNTLLSNLINYISANSSGNVVVAAPSSGLALDVNGTGRFTGALTLGSTITNGTFTYTLPSATGTLALTSSLGSYLPLSGGTLTGALNGTSATFSSLVTTSSVYRIIQASVARGGLYTYNQVTGTGTDYGIGLYSEAEAFIVTGGTTTKRLTISSTGAATFSSSVAAKSNISLSNNGAEAPILSVTSNFADGYRATLRLNNTHTGGKQWDVYSTNNSDGGFGGGKLAFVNTTDSVNALVLASTGAATFSSSVTATAPSSGIAFQVNGRSSDNIGQMLFYANNGTTLQNYLQSRPAYFSINTETNTPIYLNTNVGGAGGTVMTLTGGGNVGIGTTSPSEKLHIYSASVVEMRFENSTMSSYLRNQSDNFNFYVNGAERMRITSGGKTQIKANTSDYSLTVVNESSNAYGMYMAYSGYSPNSTNFEFIYCIDSTNSKFIVWSNGSVVNRTGSYGTISDIKFKENIVDATPKLEDITKLKVRNFNLKGESTKQIGFIAQEFEEVFPNMVDVSTERGSDGETYKSIKTSVLVPMLVKAVQELKAELDTLKNK